MDDLVDLSGVKFVKSKYSGTDNNCIEVGVWYKSKRSGTNGACVEVTILEQPVGGTAAGATKDGALAAPAHKAEYERLYVVRDSKNPDGPKLYFTPPEWEAFILGAKDGEFDDLEELDAEADERVPA